ncbi:DNA polymerase IV [Bacillaceae bacterium Marseille-Q3522]|nr:DNA polymerase IV [Bacillaceae bacterium Marseille-Q3522]
MKEKAIFLVDMESFYASIEKVENPQLIDKPVVVSGDPKLRAGVVLAACPIAKKSGVKNAERLWEAQQKCPEAIIVRPHMKRYLDVSVEITSILEKFTDLVEPYSVDEQFMDVSGSRQLFGDPFVIAQKVQQNIMRETGVRARVGIGSNKVLAKMACDNFAKKNLEGIFWLKEDLIASRLWPLPIGKMFGVGNRMEKHFHQMGIRTIGQLARFPLPLLQHRWGINGHVLWNTANGIDYSPISANSHGRQKAIGHHMTLPADYEQEDAIKIVLLELSEEVCQRARHHHVMGQTVTVSVGGADFNVHTGFHRQLTFAEATNCTMDVYAYACRLFEQFWDHEPVRSLGVSLTSLVSDDVWQMNLFENREKKLALGYVMDHIKQVYGPTAILRASSLTDAGQARERGKKIGGHYM